MSKKLGNLIKEARTRKGYTQAELAAYVDGLSAAALGKAERGEAEPTEAQVRAIAKALGVTQTSLVEAMSKKGVAKSSSAKSSTAKSSSAKTGSSKTTTGTSLKVSATEKRLVELYRKADTDTKKAVMSLLKGEAPKAEDIVSSILGSVLSSFTGQG